jgi:hypothetical protein
MLSLPCDDRIATVTVDGESRAFEEFLGLLGRTVELKGFTGFRGGLDVSGAAIRLEVVAARMERKSSEDRERLWL